MKELREKIPRMESEDVVNRNGAREDCFGSYSFPVAHCRLLIVLCCAFLFVSPQIFGISIQLVPFVVPS